MTSPSQNSKLKTMLAKLVRAKPELIDVDTASQVWNLDRDKTVWYLYSLCKQGWLSRVKRGHYLAVDIATDSKTPTLDQPWAVITELFAPCYMAGWTAAEYWGLTDQIFNTILVATSQSISKREHHYSGIDYSLTSVQESSLFGTKRVWQGRVKTQVSDPSKTIVDMFNKPDWGCGMYQVLEFYQNYLHSKHKDIDLLISYALKVNNGTVFKRLGFITEKFFPEEELIIETALKNLTKGYSALDPKLPKDKIIYRWKLWLPEDWTKEMSL